MSFVADRINRRELHKIVRQVRVLPFFPEVGYHKGGEFGIFIHTFYFLCVAFALVAENAFDGEWEQRFDAGGVGEAWFVAMVFAEGVRRCVGKRAYILLTPFPDPDGQGVVGEPVTGYFVFECWMVLQRFRADESFQWCSADGDVDQSDRDLGMPEDLFSEVVGYGAHVLDGEAVAGSPAALVKRIRLETVQDGVREGCVVGVFAGIGWVEETEGGVEAVGSFFAKMFFAAHGPFHIALSDTEPYIAQYNILEYELLISAMDAECLAGCICRLFGQCQAPGRILTDCSAGFGTPKGYGDGFSGRTFSPDGNWLFALQHHMAGEHRGETELCQEGVGEKKEEK